jgi:outer membrane protein assembly factor BamB
MTPRCTRRRTIQLGAIVTGSVLSGCTDSHSNASSEQTKSPSSPRTGSTTGRTTTTDSASLDNWPTFAHDQRNTGFNPDAVGPKDDVEVVWHFDGGTPTMDCSPVLENGVAYTGATGDGGDLSALDVATGTRNWQVDIRGWVSSAPALVDDTLYAGTVWSEFYAIDISDGTVRWTRSFDRGRFSDSSPVGVDGTVYVGMDQSPALLALNADTGETRWRFTDFDAETEAIDASPAVADGIVVFATDTHSVVALDAETGTVRWERNVGTEPDSSPAIHDGVVYYPGVNLEGDTLSRVWALDLRTGDTRWTYDVDEEQQGISPAIADSTVYVPATRNLRPRYDDGNTTETRTVTEGNRGRLYALDATTGENEWTTEITADTRSSPAIVDGVVYLGAGGGISAVRTDGSTAWRFDLTRVSPRDDLSIRSSPAVGDGRVYIGCSDGRLYALEGTTK